MQEGELVMKILLTGLLLTCCGTITAHAQISNFKHVVIIVQENRTPDNLFQGLCSAPFGSDTSCSANPNSSQYNIQTGNWLDKTSSSGFTDPKTIQLANDYDLDHSHSAFLGMCDTMPGIAGPTCKMD